VLKRGLAVVQQSLRAGEVVESERATKSCGIALEALLEELARLFILLRQEVARGDELVGWIDLR